MGIVVEFRALCVEVCQDAVLVVHNLVFLAYFDPCRII